MPPVANTDLLLYCAASMPEDNSSTSGGAIDALRRPVFTQVAVNAQVEAVSANAADTMNLTVTGRKADGTIAAETKALNGTTPIDFTTLATIERILKVELASAAAGIISIAADGASPVYGTIPAGERGFRLAFYDSASESGAIDLYEKLFWKNAHGTLALTQAKVQLASSSVGGEADLLTGVAPSKGDSATVTNRKNNAPASVTFVDDGVDQNVPTGALGAGENIGVWLKLALAANNSPIKGTGTLRLAGAST